jgi:hypothetical protein
MILCHAFNCPALLLKMYHRVCRGRREKNSARVEGKALSAADLPGSRRLRGRQTMTDLRSLDVSRVKILDKVHYRVGVQKKKNLDKGSIFSLTAVLRKGGQGGKNRDNGVLLVMARPMSITVYYEPLSETTTHTKDEKRLAPVVFALKKNSLTAVTISPNGNDLACGHRSGEIRILTNALGLVVDYHAAMDRFKQQAGPQGKSTAEKPEHPSEEVITRKLHWHSHPVATLAYDGSSSSAEPMLRVAKVCC